MKLFAEGLEAVDFALEDAESFCLGGQLLLGEQVGVVALVHKVDDLERDLRM